MAISEELGAERTVHLSAGELVYRERGDGPVLVFVHGVFVNGDLWRKVVPLLADQHRCITLDLPLGSHLTPMKPDADLSTPGLARLLLEVLETLDLTDVTLVGNDTGGAICQLAMAERPKRVSRAVLTSCDAFEVFPPSPFKFLRLVPLLPGSAWCLAQAMRLTVVRRLPTGFGWVTSRLPPPNVLDSYTRPLLDPRLRRDAVKVLRGISKVHTVNAARELVDFQHPVLIAWGGEDRLFPRALGQRLARTLPNATFVEIPHARTFVAEDEPEALAEAIATFTGAPES